ncbi:MAG: hypothetical protein A3I31_02205 [Candidatus Colwellbacteria bacterium RIFCSPLOWO2_02_FULL_44_20b]|uniref:RNA polymerase sigma factor n=1 Tax=Candidatus Colwellbacteria bacterium RIFCSPLOWO2_02_FULL_44_20b TaxID=1797691 RepID=A0A1G1Z5J9_9BACT|nr:MAG: hypothetical protein A3I31_02205 [Candidatus Colwellbacteria bacterium RIFCSPLOWO2_02_FULL_44_20b]
MCLHDFSRIPLLTPEEEPEVVRRAQEGDREAWERMICSNLRLVIFVAKRYIPYTSTTWSFHRFSYLEFIDLVQEGVLGLIRAVEKFDPDQGYRFSTYSYWWVWQAVTRALSNTGRAIRIPIHMIEELSRYSRTQQMLTQELWRSPLPHEIAAEMGISIEKVYELQGFSDLREVTSFETLAGRIFGSESDEDFADRLGALRDERMISPQEFAEHEMLVDELKELIEQLPGRESQIVVMHFGLFGTPRHTLEEIGQDFGLTRERIRQIEERALERLQTIQGFDRLKAYLPL